MFWAGQAYVKHNTLPWDYIGIDPRELPPEIRQGWLQAILDAEIENDMRMREEIESRKNGG